MTEPRQSTNRFYERAEETERGGYKPEKQLRFRFPIRNVAYVAIEFDNVFGNDAGVRVNMSIGHEISRKNTDETSGTRAKGTVSTRMVVSCEAS
jgi:hypothetical protein